jgi:hypothetical protein
LREDPSAPVPTAPTLDDPGLRDLLGDGPTSVNLDHGLDLDAPVTAGALMGRYLVIRQVGAGAMGIVLAAFDPQLDRRVALKLLRPAGWSSSGSNDGLVEEAKALAKLSHPNVVGVHDVGVHEGRVFVAMEFVEGQTLRRWLRAQPRSWAEIVDVFVAAGHGLSAAHARGLVHRDFKPDNVMIGHDGRARVMDFGLARPPVELDPHSTAPGSQLADTHEELASVLVGTPAYMAPEQLCGVGATMISDQFAFCVALYEALYGVRPFPARDVSELAAAQREGRLAEPPEKVDVPRWLARIVNRGLSHDPSMRFSSMGAVLQALEAGRSRRGRRLWFAVGGLAAGLAVVPVSQAWNARSTQWECAAEAEASRALDDGRRDAVVEALRAGDAAFADDLAQRVPKALDAYASALAAAGHDLCRLSASDNPTSLHVSKARWCVQSRREGFDALLDGLAAAAGDALRVAPYAVASLPDVAPCTDVDALVAVPLPPPPDVVAATAPLRRELARASACTALGDQRCALEATDAVVPEVVALRSAELFGRVHRIRGQSFERSGQSRQSERANTLAYESSVRAERWALAAAIATAQSRVVGAVPNQRDEALLWSELAKVAIARAGDPNGALEASRQLELGVLHAAAGDHDGARDALHRALEGASNEPMRIRAELALASSERAAGRSNSASRAMHAALDARVGLLGPSHPDVVRIRLDLRGL